MSTAEVVARAIRIVTAIDGCGCEHCLELLKKGLREPTPEPDADDDLITIPGTNQNGGQDRDKINS